MGERKPDLFNNDDSRSSSQDRPKLAISFSGGRTSALMTKMVLDRNKLTHDIRVTFANTGCEHEDTLRFVNECDIRFGFAVVWLEADISPESGVGVRHKVVSFETASRQGEPYEAFIRKYGIPNRSMPQCTSRLKTEVMESYLKSQGFYRGKRLNYDTAIGIRADEIDRMSSRHREERLVYPLISAGVRKEDVITYWSQYDWDLRIPEHLGNCTWCWKKSDRKLFTLAVDYPEVFNFPSRMDATYANLKAKNGPRRFFRGNRTAQEIMKLAYERPFKKFGEIELFDPTLDTGSACGESCEIGSDENEMSNTDDSNTGE